MGAGMELSPEERARVQEAFQRGVDEDFWLPESQKVKRPSKDNLDKLARAWQALSEEDRDDIRFALAERVGNISDPWILDVGGIASELAAQTVSKGGRPRKYPGIHEAVRVLFDIWVERGNPREVGNLRQKGAESSNLTPSPACEFVAAHLYHLAPNYFNRIHNPDQRHAEILRTADTHLRALPKPNEN